MAEAKQRKRYKHLSYEERIIIGQKRKERSPLAEIGRLLGRASSTISREIRRNEQFAGTRYWYAIHAQMKANGRRRRTYRKERLRSKQLQEQVEERLREGWSPQQIAGRMKQQKRPERISHEAIYQWIYSQRGDLRVCLAWGRRRRYRRGHSKRHTRSHIPNCRPLKERSLAANLRQELGHWESDLAVGKQNKAAFVVSVERQSRLLRVSKVKDQTARSVSRAIIRQLKALPARSRKSISYDHGHENVRHEKVNAALGTESFFCEPYHSWEKGSVENSIGLIRRYYPDRSDLSLLTARAVRRLQNKLNHRPRKILGYSTPQEVFDAQSGALHC
jgi:transposase, IS30 family